jgi:hypothetical protein
MRKALFIGIMLTCLGSRAYANNEYVNPIFCYRIVFPDDTSRVTPNASGSGVTIELDGPCEHAPCIRIAIAASYLGSGGDVTRTDHRHESTQGWTLQTTARRQVQGVLWNERQLSSHGNILVIYENADHHDQADYIVTMQSSQALAKSGQKAVEAILESWRWLSGCF